MRYVQIVINEIRHNIDTYKFLKKDNGGVVYIVAQIYIYSLHNNTSVQRGGCIAMPVCLNTQ